MNAIFIVLAIVIALPLAAFFAFLIEIYGEDS